MPATITPRLAALDWLRGAAVAGMILAESPGDWGATWPWLRHAEWHGWTTTDMVFPTFLFGVGAALGLSLPRALDATYWRRVGRRVVTLILLGLLLEWTYNLAIGWGAIWFPGHPGLANIRLPGVLQRIALCYGIAALLIAATARRLPDGRRDLDPRAVLVAVAVLLLGYWALLRFVPVPGFGVGRLDPEGNLTAWLDRLIVTVPHMWPLGQAHADGPVVYDPEGLLSTLPAATDTLLGAVAGHLWRRHPDRAALLVALGGAALVAAGLLLDPVIPINKRIWTSSFALLSSGVAALALAALSAAARSPLAVRLLTPLKVLGGNAILAFAISTLFGRLYGFPLFGPDRDSMAHQFFEGMLTIVPDPNTASFLCALAVLAAITLLLWPLHRRAIHFRL